MENYEKKADENLVALKQKDENNRKMNVMVFILFSITLFTGIMVCLICNLAVSGRLTWSPIPVSSMVFAWVIFFPGIIMGKKGITASLLSFSVFIIPYLFLLSRFIKVKEVCSIGAAMAVVSIIFLWIIVAVVRRMGKTRRFAALGITFLLCIPLVWVINGVLANMTAEPVFDVWDMLTVFLLLLLAFVFFLCDHAKKKGLLK